MINFSDRFYIGKAPYILITDLDMLKQIFVKDFNNFMDHAVRLILLANSLMLKFLSRLAGWTRNDTAKGFPRAFSDERGYLEDK